MSKTFRHDPESNAFAARRESLQRATFEARATMRHHAPRAQAFAALDEKESRR
jgi:hypothetical protein